MGACPARLRSGILVCDRVGDRIRIVDVSDVKMSCFFLSLPREAREGRPKAGVGVLPQNALAP